MVVRGRSARGLLERISAHDRFQIEVKRNYVPGRAEQTRYELYTYLFLPYTLGISARTYSPADFYRNLQNYVRLRTPRIPPEEIFECDSSPIVRLERLANDPTASARLDRVVANLKLLHPVAKTTLTALSQSAAAVEGPAEDYPVETTQRALEFCGAYLAKLRSLREPLAALSSKEADSAYRVVDETLSLLAEQALLERHEGLDRLLESKKAKKLRGRIRDFVAVEQRHRD